VLLHRLTPTVPAYHTVSPQTWRAVRWARPEVTERLRPTPLPAARRTGQAL